MAVLIAKGADVNAKADNGLTPLDGAILGEEIEAIELLIKNGGKLADQLLFEELKAEGK